MGTAGILILIVIGAGLVVWGLWQVRSGMADYERVQRQLVEQAEELRSAIAEVKRDLEDIAEERDTEE